jgi:hypothetical protein
MRLVAAGKDGALPDGYTLILRREPNNKFDRLAVAVFAYLESPDGEPDREICLGYIPKRDNPPLAARLDAQGTPSEINGPSEAKGILRYSKNSLFPHVEISG